MPRVKVGPALPDVSTLDVEIARLREAIRNLDLQVDTKGRSLG